MLLDDVAMGQERTTRAPHPSHPHPQLGQDETEGPMGAEEFQESNEEIERIQSLLERVQATRLKSN